MIIRLIRSITPAHPGGRTKGVRASLRRPALRLASASLLVLLLPACLGPSALSDDLQDAIDEAADGLPSIEDREAVLEIGKQVADGSLPLPDAIDVPGDVSLDDYVRISLERNPRILARVRDLQALGLRVPQVTSLADPMLSITPPTSQMLQTAAGEMDGALGISQGIPFPGKLATQGRIAEQVVRIALENLRAERLSVIASVKQAYYAHYLACVSIDVTRDNLQLLTRMRDVAQAKYAAGRAPQQDLLRAEVEIYSVTNELITLEQRSRTAVARLNTLMDRDVLAPLPVPARVSPLNVAARIDELLERAVQENPALATWREQATADLEAVHLAELQYYPDFNIGALFTFIASSGVSPVADGSDAWSLGLGLSLPIWLDRLRAGVLERHARVLATVERYRGARNDLLFAVQDLSVRVDSAFRRAILLRDGILPRAHQTVQVSESGYQAGELDFTTLIGNWQRLLDLTLSYHEALSTLEQEVAELERLLGGTLDRDAPELHESEDL